MKNLFVALILCLIFQTNVLAAKDDFDLDPNKHVDCLSVIHVPAAKVGRWQIFEDRSQASNGDVFAFDNLDPMNKKVYKIQAYAGCNSLAFEDKASSAAKTSVGTRDEFVRRNIEYYITNFTMNKAQLRKELESKCPGSVLTKEFMSRIFSPNRGEAETQNSGEEKKVIKAE